MNERQHLTLIDALEDTLRHVTGHPWGQIVSWLIMALALGILIFYGVKSFLSDNRDPVHLVVYAFSTQEEVCTQHLFPAFEQAWEQENGRDLTIEGVFGPSGTLASQIILGAPGDVALFSNAQHATWLKAAHIIRADTEPVLIGYTPMVIVTRPGNPANLTVFADLAQPGLRLLHANPRTSGAGDWALLAEYGSFWLGTGDDAAAFSQLTAIWHNVRLLAPSARATLTLFELGAGDALVTYEQDARLAQDRGVPLEIVIPAQTILAQYVAVIVDDNVTGSERVAAQAFLDYLMSDEGQVAMSHYNLRSAAANSEALPPLAQSFTVEDLGGWSQIYPGLIETLWREEIEPRLELDTMPNLLGPKE